MILADKIIRLRKKNGWSQEELATRMNVSRQAVSKWEAASTTPDLEKILELSNLFGVTIDYLLKDEIEDEEYLSDDNDGVRYIGLEEAKEYMDYRESISGRIALGTLLCITSPLPLILVGGISETKGSLISEDFAGLAGIIILLVMVALAVMLFLSVDMKNSKYKYIKEEDFEAGYGVKGMVSEKMEMYRSFYNRVNMISTIMCILSPVILIYGAFSRNDLTVIIALVIMICLIGVAVYGYVYVGVRWASYELLLKTGEYEKKNKESSRIISTVSTVYWLLVTALYLGVSFMLDDFRMTWIIWVIAGILYAAIRTVLNLIVNKNNK